MFTVSESLVPVYLSLNNVSILDVLTNQDSEITRPDLNAENSPE